MLASAGAEARAGQLHHVEIYVSELSRSLAFWGPFLGRLGYAEVARWGEPGTDDAGSSWALGGTYLCFVQAPRSHLGAGYHRKRVGLNHLAFHAAGRAQVDDFRAWVREQAWPMLYDGRYPFAGGPGYYALYLEDPDRIKVELVAPRED